MKRLALSLVMSLAFVAFLAPNAFSDSIDFTTTQYFNGTGIGNTIHVLSLQQTPPSTNEAGSVTFSGTLTGDAKPNSNTWTAAQLIAEGLSATNFGIVFNPNETGPAGNTVDVYDFTLNFFDSSGVSLGDASTNGLPINLLPISTGTGSSGWLMAYNNNTGLLTTFFSDPTNVLAATGEVRNTDNGPDNFYLINPLIPPPPVPEPSALLLLGSGLVGLAVYGRKAFKR